MKTLSTSTSTVHGSDYLEYLLPESTLDIATVLLFIPYARDLAVFHEEYTAKASAFHKINIAVKNT
jgi:dipeptidase E